MDKKEEYLNELLENPSGAQVLSDKLSQLLDDKEFYKYGLLVPIIEKLLSFFFDNTFFCFIWKYGIKPIFSHFTKSVKRWDSGYCRDDFGCARGARYINQ